MLLAHGIIPCGQELPLIGMALAALPLAFMWVRRALSAVKARIRP
jgi:hypothetical protein